MADQNYTVAARTTSFVGDDNRAVRPGTKLTVVMDVTVVPGGDTVQAIVEGRDTLSGKYYPVLSSAATAAVGTTVLLVGDGLPATANASANSVVPQTYRIRVQHSASTLPGFTYTISAREG